MKESKPAFRMSTKNGLLLLLVLGVLWLGVRSHYIQLDYRFKTRTANGLKGLILYELGDYQGSARAYRADLQDAYRKWDPEEETPRLWFMRGDFNKARKMAEENLQTGKNEAQSLLVLGEIFLEEESYEEAVTTFKRALQVEDDYFDALLLSSVAHVRLGGFDQAIGLLNRAMRHNQLENYRSSFLRALKTAGFLSNLPEGRKPYSLLATFHRYLRIYDGSQGAKAKRYAKKAIKKGDHLAAAYLTLGIVLENDGKRGEALEVFKMGAASDPPDPEILRWMGNLYGRMGDLPNEFRMRSAAAEAAPGDYFYFNSLGYFLEKKLGDFPGALSMTESFLVAQPNHVPSLERAGYYHSKLGNLDRALQLFEKAIRYDPDRSSVYMRIGNIYKMKNQITRATEVFQKAIDLNPDEMGARVGLGEIYWDLQQMDLALIEYEKAYRSGYLREEALGTLCTLYRDAGQYEKAVSCLKKVLARDPEDAYAKQLLRYSLMGLKKKEFN